MQRPLRKLLLSLVTLLVLAVGAVSTLTLSEPGSRWLLRQALERLPGELQIAAIHGRLISGLVLDGIDYRLQQTAVHAEQLVVRWQPAGLLRGTLHIQQLLLRDVHFTVGEAPADSPPFKAPESILLPLTVALDELRIDKLQLDSGGGQTAIDSVALSARAGPLQGLVVRHFAIRMQDSRAQLSAKAALHQPYAFKGKLDWQTRLQDGVDAAGHASLNGDLSRVNLEHTLSQPFHVTTQGSVQLDAAAPVLALQGQWQKIQWPLAGAAGYSSAHGDYSIDGTLSSYKLTLSGALAGADIPSAQVQASGQVERERIHIESLVLDTLGGTASASGVLSWAPQFSLRLAIHATQLDPGQQWPVGKGQLDLHTDLAVDSDERNTRVTLRDLDLHGTLRDQALSAKGTLTFNNGVPSTPKLVVNAGANRASVAGTLDPSGVRFTVEAPQLTTLLPGLGGQLQAQGRLTGPADRLGGDMELTADGLAYQGNRAGKLQARVRIVPGKEHAANIDLDAQNVVVGSTPVDQLTLHADGTLANHAARLQLTAPQGSALLSVQGGYRDASWNGRLETATLTPADSASWQLREPVALRIDRQRAEPFKACWASDGREACLQGDWRGDSAQLQLSGQSSEGHLRGTVDIRDLQSGRPALDGRIDANIPDIRFLDALLPDASIAAGAITAQAQLSGYLDAPEITGRATLAGGELKVAELGLDITAISLQARGSGPRVTVNGSAHAGDGEVRLSGDLLLDPQRNWPFDLSLKGERFALSQLPDMEITANPDLRLQGSAQRADVRGSVTIPHARITLKKLPPDVVRVSADQVIVETTAQPATSASGYPVSLNVVATLGDKVHFEGLGLSTDLGGSLNVRSLQTDTLIGNGVLELRNGRYEGYGQKLSIEQGRLLFAGPLDNPALDVRATRTVGSVVAGIELYGTAEAPQTRLFSDPAMSDAEIMAYLVTGKPLGASSSSSDSQALAAAAASFGANSPVAQEISQKLGVEVGVQSGTTDSDTALVVSKQLSSRLSVDYVYGMFNESAAIQFIYKLTDHLSLSGQSGAVQSIDLNYSINRP